MASSEPLSDDEIKVVQSSWNDVADRRQQLAIEILSKLFQKHPNYQDYFAFDKVLHSELSQNEHFIKHAKNVAEALNSAVISLYKTDELIHLLERVKKTHERKNVTKNMLKDAKLVILEVLRSKFTQRMDEKFEVAWNKTLDAVITLIAK